MVSVFLSLLVVKENNNACSYENTYLFEKLFRKLRRNFCSRLYLWSKFSSVRPHGMQEKSAKSTYQWGRFQNNFQDHRRLWKIVSGYQKAGTSSLKRAFFRILELVWLSVYPWVVKIRSNNCEKILSGCRNIPRFVYPFYMFISIFFHLAICRLHSCNFVLSLLCLSLLKKM
jgi:hypothetical protein